jgi:hypothetical protein
LELDSAWLIFVEDGHFAASILSLQSIVSIIDEARVKYFDEEVHVGVPLFVVDDLDSKDVDVLVARLDELTVMNNILSSLIVLRRYCSVVDGSNPDPVKGDVVMLANDFNLNPFSGLGDRVVSTLEAIVWIRL